MPHLRFYIKWPLISHKGHFLGCGEYLLRRKVGEIIGELGNLLLPRWRYKRREVLHIKTKEAPVFIRGFFHEDCET